MAALTYPNKNIFFIVLAENFHPQLIVAFQPSSVVTKFSAETKKVSVRHENGFQLKRILAWSRKRVTKANPGKTGSLDLGRDFTSMVSSLRRLLEES